MTLRELHGKLRDRGVAISMSTLSYWRSGQRRPERVASLDAVYEIEDLLDLPRLYLTSRLGPSRRPGHVAPPAPLDEVVVGPKSSCLAEHLAALGLDDALDGVREVSVHVTITVAARQIRAQSARYLYRAVRPDVRTLPLIYADDDHTLTQPPRVEELGGCDLGRVILDEENGVYVFELVLDRPMQPGETALVEHTASLRTTPADDDNWEQFLMRPAREAVLWVRFEREDPPRTCTGYRRDGEGNEELVALVVNGSSAHHFQHRFGPGAVGISWSWT